MNRTKIVASVLVAGTLAATGVAAAVDLPEAANDKARTAVEGATTDDAQAKAAEHRQNEADDDATETVKVEEDEGVESEESEGQENRPEGTHGYEVSQLATTTESEGRDKGEEISTLAQTNGEQHRAESDSAASEAGAEGKAKAEEARAGKGR